MKKNNSQIVGGQIPIPNIPSECAIETKDICAPSSYINIMREFLKKNESDISKLSNADIINKLKEKLNIETEAEIWDHPLVKSFIGPEKSEELLKVFFKPEGPNDSTALLDNFNIDEELDLWSKHSKIMFNKLFYHVPFQMIDFAIKGTELSKLDIFSLIKKRYDCFAVVLNTDVSSGRGKHWFCIYGDLQHKGTQLDPIYIEYFNSSGNPPMSEVDLWLEQTKHELLKNNKIYCEIIRSAPKRLQYSMTECGVWSLMYIKSRLMDHESNWFYKVQADDKDMVELRKHLFRKQLSKK